MARLVVETVAPTDLDITETNLFQLVHDSPLKFDRASLDEDPWDQLRDVDELPVNVSENETLQALAAIIQQVDLNVQAAIQQVGPNAQTATQQVDPNAQTAQQVGPNAQTAIQQLTVALLGVENWEGSVGLTVCVVLSGQGWYQFAFQNPAAAGRHFSTFTRAVQKAASPLMKLVM